MQRTEIATLGEFGLIKHLTEGIKLQNESSKYGVGDDCAVLQYPADKQILVTSDLLMEGVHFDLTYVPLKHLGYKSAMVNISDIYAMNGMPKQMIVSIALSKRFSLEDMEDFTRNSIKTRRGKRSLEKFTFTNEFGRTQTEIFWVKSPTGTPPFDHNGWKKTFSFGVDEMAEVVDVGALRGRIHGSPTVGK